jgi:hypothetical protein
MAGIPRHQGRTEPKIGPSDSSDTIADRPGAENTDSDAGGTGERVTAGRDPRSELHVEDGADRVVDASEAGLGGGLDEAEEARLRRPRPPTRRAKP